MYGYCRWTGLLVCRCCMDVLPAVALCPAVAAAWPHMPAPQAINASWPAGRLLTRTAPTACPPAHLALAADGQQLRHLALQGLVVAGLPLLRSRHSVDDSSSMRRGRWQGMRGERGGSMSACSKSHATAARQVLAGSVWMLYACALAGWYDGAWRSGQPRTAPHDHTSSRHSSQPVRTSRLANLMRMVNMSRLHCCTAWSMSSLLMPLQQGRVAGVCVECL